MTDRVLPEARVLLEQLRALASQPSNVRLNQQVLVAGCWWTVEDIAAAAADWIAAALSREPDRREQIERDYAWRMVDSIPKHVRCRVAGDGDALAELLYKMSLHIESEPPRSREQEVDYKAAWDEMHRVYGKAVELLERQPRSYLGWNWVHALVDALSREAEETATHKSWPVFCPDCDHGIRGGVPCETCGGSGAVDVTLALYR